MWTSDTGAPYMVLTAHWINDEWNLKHVIIAFQRFPHPHTGQQIQEATFKIFQDFSITTKALTITIDNGANQVAAIKLLSTKLSRELQVDFNVIRCGAHTSVTTRGYFPSVSSVSVNPYPRIFGYLPDNP